MLIRLPMQEIISITAAVGDLVNADVRDEMAIPSYLHPNALIRWIVWQRHVVIERLADLGKETRVLDFGCGVGIFLPTLCARAGKVLACDLYPQFAQELVARRDLDVEFVTSLDVLPDSSLDVIIAAEVLEHLPDLEEMFDLMKRKLRSHGQLLISAPTEGVFYQLGRIVAGFKGKGHYHHRNAADIRSTIDRMGFRILRSRGLPFVIPPHLYKVYDVQV